MATAARKKSATRKSARRTITVIPGDGIGPEIADSMMQVVGALELPIDFEVVDAGLEAFERTGELLPPRSTRASARTRSRSKARPRLQWAPATRASMCSCGSTISSTRTSARSS